MPQSPYSIVPQPPPQLQGPQKPLPQTDQFGNANPVGKGPLGVMAPGLNNAIQGILGFIGVGNSGDKANQLGQLVNAGMPFAAPLGRVFHATPAAFETFNPAMGARNDTFGGFQPHMAENPAAIEQFERPSPGKGSNPNVIAIHPDIKNALDLSEPLNSDDISKIAAALPEKSGSLYTGRPGPYNGYGDFSKEELLQHWKADQKHNMEKPGSVYGDTHRYIRNALQHDPTLLTKAGFDGLKYLDIGGAGPSWVAADPTQLKSALSGAPLGVHDPTRALEMARAKGAKGPIPLPPSSQEGVKVRTPPSTKQPPPSDTRYEEMLKKFSQKK